MEAFSPDTLEQAAAARVTAKAPFIRCRKIAAVM
jgi:hypothetical protein